MDTAKEIRGRIYALRELRELNLDDMRKLYGLTPITTPPDYSKITGDYKVLA